MDASERIRERLLRAVGNLEDDDPISRQQHVALHRISTILVTPESLEIMARAADQEEAAQKGEPSPWRDDLQHRDGCEHVLAPIRICDCPHVDPEFLAERCAAMLCALQAVGLA